MPRYNGAAEKIIDPVWCLGETDWRIHVPVMPRINGDAGTIIDPELFPRQTDWGIHVCGT